MHVPRWWCSFHCILELTPGILILIQIELTEVDDANNTEQMVHGAIGANRGALLSGSLGGIGWFAGGVCSSPLGGDALCTSGTTGWCVGGLSSISLGGGAICTVL